MKSFRIWIFCSFLFTLACFLQYLSLRYLENEIFFRSVLYPIIWICTVFSSFLFIRVFLYCLPPKWALFFFVIDQGQHKPQQWKNEFHPAFGLCFDTPEQIQHARNQLRKASSLFLVLFLTLQSVTFYEINNDQNQNQNHDTGYLIWTSIWTVLNKHCTSLFLVQAMFLFKSFLSVPLLESIEQFRQSNPYRVRLDSMPVSSVQLDTKKANR